MVDLIIAYLERMADFMELYLAISSYSANWLYFSSQTNVKKLVHLRGWARKMALYALTHAVTSGYGVYMIFISSVAEQPSRDVFFQILVKMQRGSISASPIIQVLGNEDLLCTVFSHLPPADRPAVTLVCKEWNRAANSASTWKTLHFTDPGMTAADIASICAKYPHIVQMNVKGLDTKLGIQLARHSALSHLKSLSLHRMPLMYGPPLVLNSFPHLTALQLDCPAMANAAALDLPSLQTLLLHGMYLTAFACPALLDLDVRRSWCWDQDLTLLSRLRSLRIVSCTTSDLQWRSLKLEQVRTLFIENWAVDSLGLHCPLATHCEFRGTGEWLSLRLDAPGVEKVVVHAKGCLKAITLDCPMLRCLDVGEGVVFEDDFWSTLPEKCPLTSHIVLRGYASTSVEMTRALACFKGLTRLTSSSPSTPRFLNCGALQILEIRDYSTWQVADFDDVMTYHRNFPKLRKIKLSGIHIDKRCVSLFQKCEARWAGLRLLVSS